MDAAYGSRIVKTAVGCVLAGLILGILDAAVSVPPLASQFVSSEATLEFALRLCLLPLAPLLLFSLVLGGCAVLFDRLSAGDRSRYSWLWAILSLPYITWVAGQIFSGPQAQKITGRQVVAALVGALALIGVRMAVLFVLRAHDWAFAKGQGGTVLRRLLLFALGVALAVGCYLVDRRLLPRLYPWFHLSLEVLAVASAQAAIYCGLELRLAFPARRWLRFTLIGFLLLLSFNVSLRSLLRLHRATVLRGLVLEKTTLGAALMRPYATWRTGGEKPRRASLLPTKLEAEAPPPLYSGPRLAGRDVFLITVDALRHDRLRKETMPFTTGLKKRAIDFSRAYTQVPHTSFAVATLLTGKPVYALMALGHEAQSHETLPMVLRRFRYKTAAFYPPSVFFIEHERLKPLEDSAYGFEYVKYEYLSAPRRTEQVMAFLETEKPQRAFVWVHYLEPHEPYEPHDQELRGGGPGPQADDQARYDGEVRFVDQEIERLVTYIEKQRPGALIIIAADHGEEFGEHGGRYHGTALYEEQVHVPLLIAELPLTSSSAPLLAPRTLRQPVGLIDVAPTLLGLLDIERSARMRGHDLSPWLLSGRTELPLLPVFAEIGRKKMVVLGDNKLLCDLVTDTCQAFTLDRDPEERHNAIDADPATAQRLRSTLDHFLDEARRFELGADANAQAPLDAAAADDLAILARARLGDRSVLAKLAAQLGKPSLAAQQKRQALALGAQLLATTPPAENVSANDAAPKNLRIPEEALTELRRAFDEAKDAPDMSASVQKRWAAIALTRLASSTQLADDKVTAEVIALIKDATADANQRLYGALALHAEPDCKTVKKPGQWDCVAAWLAVLPAALDLGDAERVRPLLVFLGQSHDPRVLGPLLKLLENVLSRADLVNALGVLGERAAVPDLAKLLDTDPYVHVRAAAANALGALGGSAARAALVNAQARERETMVKSAITSALASMH